jgi:RNA polymerase sigma-70 factor (ECF subfamily)
VNWVDSKPVELVRACAQPNATAAWEEFVDRYHSLLTSAAIRVSRRWGKGTSEEIDDIVQEMYLKLCDNSANLIASFRDDRPEAFLGYLKVVATNIAHDFFRRLSAAKRGTRRTTSLSDMEDFLGASNELERNLTLSELDSIMLVRTEGQYAIRDRAIFRLYYRHGMTAAAIGCLPGIRLSTKGVEAVLHRLTKEIREFVRPPQGKDDQ